MLENPRGMFRFTYKRLNPLKPVSGEKGVGMKGVGVLKRGLASANQGMGVLRLAAAGWWLVASS